jgi:hypothetical protein
MSMFGAGHPHFKNDTFLLYQRGWRGINIEPDYGFHAALMEERPRDINLRVVLSDRPRENKRLPTAGLDQIDVAASAPNPSRRRPSSSAVLRVAGTSELLADCLLD